MEEMQVGGCRTYPPMARGHCVLWTRRRSEMYEVFVTGEDVWVTNHGTNGGRGVWRVTFIGAYTPTESMRENNVMGSKWITQAIAKRAKKTKQGGELDPVLSKGRPALTDFMTELLGADDKERDLSVLMITATADGLRVGLKDEDAGGWCWREAATLGEALDAIEKALQAGSGAFRAAGGWRGKKK